MAQIKTGRKRKVAPFVVLFLSAFFIDHGWDIRQELHIRPRLNSNFAATACGQPAILPPIPPAFAADTVEATNRQQNSDKEATGVEMAVNKQPTKVPYRRMR